MPKIEKFLVLDPDEHEDIENVRTLVTFGTNVIKPDAYGRAKREQPAWRSLSADDVADRTGLKIGDLITNNF